jgi:L-threonylcarbamoyladenylate synthase
MIFDEDIKESVKTLRESGVLVYPTDTIWGLGCDPTSESAINKIFRIKERGEGKSLIILADSLQMVERYVSEIPEIVYELAEVSDTPLTIIYPMGKNLAAGVCSNDGSVAIRICHDEFCLELINRFRKPIVSTSANFSGSPSPGNFTEIEQGILIKADYVVKYRQDDRGISKASPVIKVNPDGTFKIIRM